MFNGGRVGPETKNSTNGAPLNTVTTKGWTLESLLETGKNFRPIERISALDDPEEIKRKVQEYEDKNIPLIVEDCHKHKYWNEELFTVKHLERANSDDEDGISVRNCTNRVDTKMKFSEFDSKCRETSKFAVNGESERYYGKDLICPVEWKEWLLSQNALPENTTLYGSGDLLRLLLPQVKVETLMCYQGIGDTFTPAHKDPCASSGQNLMVITEGDACSYWFMVEGSDASQAAEYFHLLGHELDLEKHFASPEELSSAPFPIYIGKQVLGDHVLVPKRCCHQVINSGGVSVKLSWSRMTVDGLTTAFHHELPLYRRWVCRPETYRVKLTVLRTLQYLTKKLREETLTDLRQKLEERSSLTWSVAKNQWLLQGLTTPRIPIPQHVEKLVKEMIQILDIFDKISKEEFVEAKETDDPEILEDGRKQVEGSESFTSMTCDYCGADIFQSFFECSSCGDPDFVQICVGCSAEGRSCRCGKAKPRQRCGSDLLFKIQNEAVEAVRPFTGIEDEIKPVRLGLRSILSPIL
ncbi:hypothetical protein SCHPADRAFT_830444 [Schizopora paradoxa]|uniref:JmjC domain-containing protein n=1 Tax=Schizopora paradoxa TaxID=27342 RepID=A0A0H2RJS4_9AGAM|nr:hypothetical protein SCHPADRAFT_830444 [Schizopora paradoxa]